MITIDFFFWMHTMMRPQRLKIKPKDFVSLSQDKDGFDVQYINSLKGKLTSNSFKMRFLLLWAENDTWSNRSRSI